MSAEKSSVRLRMKKASSNEKEVQMAQIMPRPGAGIEPLKRVNDR